MRQRVGAKYYGPVAANCWLRMTSGLSALCVLTYWFADFGALLHSTLLAIDLRWIPENESESRRYCCCVCYCARQQADDELIVGWKCLERVAGEVQRSRYRRCCFVV